MAFWKPSRTAESTAASPASASVPVIKRVATEIATRNAPRLDVQLARESNLEIADAEGFDPYNSGAFNFKDTWSRVTRK